MKRRKVRQIRTDSKDVGMALVHDAGPNALLEAVARSSLGVLVLLPDSRGQALGHPVVVLAQVGHVTAVTGAALSRHQVVDLLSCNPVGRK